MDEGWSKETTETEEHKPMGLPDGPSTAFLVLLVLLSRTAFRIYARRSYDMETISYRLWAWSVSTEAWNSYKRYPVEYAVMAGEWGYLLKHLP